MVILIWIRRWQRTPNAYDACDAGRDPSGLITGWRQFHLGCVSIVTAGQLLTPRWTSLPSRTGMQVRQRRGGRTKYADEELCGLLRSTLTPPTTG